MPVDETEGQEDGSTLRKKLEAALKENRELKTRVTGLEAEKVVTSYPLVKAEDLEGVEPDQVKAQAEKLQAERIEARKTMARELLSLQGLEGDDLEVQVEAFLEGKSATAALPMRDEAAESIERARSYASLPGTPVSQSKDTPFGFEGMKAALAEMEKKSTPRT